MENDPAQDNVVEFPVKIKSALWAGVQFFGAVVFCLGVIICAIGYWLVSR